jgi:hypothetical protein
VFSHRTVPPARTLTDSGVNLNIEIVTEAEARSLEPSPPGEQATMPTSKATKQTAIPMLLTGYPRAGTLTSASLSYSVAHTAPSPTTTPMSPW